MRLDTTVVLQLACQLLACLCSPSVALSLAFVTTAHVINTETPCFNAALQKELASVTSVNNSG